LSVIILGCDQAERSGFCVLRREGANTTVLDSGIVTTADARAQVVQWSYRQAAKLEADRPLLIALEKHIWGSAITRYGLGIAKGKWLQCIEEASIGYKQPFKLVCYTPQIWRAEVLGLHRNTEREDAKLAARKYAALALGKLVQEVDEDESDAVGIAFCASLIEKDPMKRKWRQSA
jgi:Holliday junction resolvasome RuvABC endonuclease subunit